MFSLLGLLILILSVSFHEWAHALIADRLGDPTPRAHGRLTLNPLAHADLFGTILLPLVLLITGSPIFFAWAKPVPIDPYNLKNPRRDEALLAFAGPATNLLLALIFALFARFTGPSTFTLTAVLVNLSLAIFNLLPLIPLDGSKILLGLLPLEKSLEWEEALRHYSSALLILLILPLGGQSLISRFISPLISTIFHLIYPLF